MTKRTATLLLACNLALARYAPPTIASFIGPPEGTSTAGGDVVVIQGSNFGPAVFENAIGGPRRVPIRAWYAACRPPPIPVLANVMCTTARAHLDADLHRVCCTSLHVLGCCVA